MKNMFAGDPWYNGQGQQGGVQGMGFRPGPVQIAMVRPAPMPQPTFGAMPTQMTPMQPQQPLLAQAQPQQYQQQFQQQPQAPRPQAPAQGVANGRVPMGQKANCPVCRNFGG